MSGTGRAGAVRRRRIAAAPTDRRVARTRDRLGDALIELIQEQPFDRITVQHVLDRAGVGRSTFYAHYSDKDDLLTSDVVDFLEAMSTVLIRRREDSDRVAPVREFFAHVAEAEPLWQAFVAAGRIHDFLDLARGHFARAIEQRLGSRPRTRALGAAERAALGEGYAGALIALLVRWIREGTRESPEAMDAVFHRLVWHGPEQTKREGGAR